MSETIKKRIDDKTLARLGKMAELAKNGVGGEKENALRKVREICDAHGLDFDKVLANEEERRPRTVAFKNKLDERLLVQVILRYGDPTENEIFRRRGKKELMFETTDSAYMEAIVALDVFRTAFNEELDLFFRAFVYRHNIFATKKSKSKKVKEDSGEDMSLEDTMRLSNLMQGMKDVEVTRRLN